MIILALVQAILRSVQGFPFLIRSLSDGETKLMETIMMTKMTRKIATALGIAGIIACGSIAMGATSAYAASAYGNGNVNDIASYDTNDAYGAVRGGAALDENGVAKRDGACDAYADVDGDDVCDNCLQDDCQQNINGSMSARCEDVNGRNYVDADDDSICDNYASRHDGDNAQHHRERHSNSRNGYEHRQGYQHRANHR